MSLNYLKITSVSFFYRYYVDIMIFYMGMGFIILSQTKQTLLINDYALLIANSLMLFATYFINKISDVSEDMINNLQVVKINTKIILFITNIYLISLLLYTSKNNHVLLIYWLLFFIIGIFYSFPKKYKLKRILLIKNIIPSFLWYFSLCVMIFSIYENNQNILEIMYLMFPYFMFFLMFSILFDLPDIKGDKTSNIKTIPVIIGLQKTKILLSSLLLIMLFTINNFEGRVITLILLTFLINISEKFKKIHYQLLLTFILCIKIILYFYVSK